MEMVTKTEIDWNTDISKLLEKKENEKESLRPQLYVTNQSVENVQRIHIERPTSYNKIAFPISHNNYSTDLVTDILPANTVLMYNDSYYHGKLE